MSLKFKSLINALALSCLLLSSVTVNAVAINTKRLYLHPTDQANTALTVVNAEGVLQECTVQVNPAYIDDAGLIKWDKSNLKPEIDRMVRFAPRKFKLKPEQHQAIKLMYRKRTETEANEHFGLLRVRCAEVTEAKGGKMVNVSAVLAHNVPVIVRTKSEPLNINFSKLQLKGNFLDAELTTNGARTITGWIEVADQQTGDIIARTNDISIYPKVPVKAQRLKLDENLDLPITVTFKENASYGGKLQFQQVIR